MKFIILLLSLSVSAWGATLTSEFKSIALQKFAVKVQGVLDNVDLAPNKKIYKLSLKRDLETTTQVQDLLYSYYLDGTQVMTARGWSAKELQTHMRKLYYYDEQPDLQAKQSLKALVAILSEKLARYANLSLMASEPEMGDFGKMAGFVLKDKLTSEAYVLLTGFSE